MDSLKIAMLHYSAPPVVGGVELVIQQHARLFTEAGHFVRVLAGKGALEQAGTETVIHPLFDSSNAEILAIKKKLDGGQIPAEFLRVKDILLKFLREQLKDRHVFIAHNICSLHKNLALTAALHEFILEDESPPMIAWHHDLAWTNGQYRRELKDRWPWDLLKIPWHAHKQHHVAVSAMRQNEISQLFNLPGKMIQVIPSGMDWCQFLNIGDQTENIINQLDLLDADPLFLLPARITRRKNIELAIRLVGHLRDTFPGVVLLVTGPPGPHNPGNQSYFEELLALRADLGLGDWHQPGVDQARVIFLAEHFDQFLPDEIIADLYRFADALLMPSSQEGFGIPILEAGLVGMPIFCSDIPPFRETAGDLACFFAPDDDPKMIADRIEKTLKEDKRIHLKCHIRRNYTWQNVFARKIMPLVQLVVKTKRGDSVR